MIYVNDTDALRKQNNLIAKTNAKIAKKTDTVDNVQAPMEMVDAKSMAEFFAELLSYAPSLLQEAVN